tara:strand:+ start:3517 stop:4401 length:885 start_codon:yes stop_codon:yes gene_type:complete
LEKSKSKTKGIILAAGRATRLFPITISVNKQLLAVYDKPMIYYPLSVLMLSNIKDILIITKKEDLKAFKALLGNGKKIGINISYALQSKPKGIADAFKIGEKFIKKSKCALILGDNIFYGQNFREKLFSAKSNDIGATIFSYPVHDPQRYGVVELDKNNNPYKLIEKPKRPKSNLAVTGLYFYDNEVVQIVKKLKPSKRGELEITDVNKEYLKRKKLHMETFGRGFAWLDTGTPESLLTANNFIANTEQRQGLKIACLEEIAYLNKWINYSKLKKLTHSMSEGPYKNYLLKILK